MSNTVATYFTYALLSGTAIILLRVTGTSVSLPLDFTPQTSTWLGGLFLAALLYAASFAVWAYILSKNEVTLAYPICFGLTLVVSTILAIIFLNESLTLVKIGGMALMVGSVFCLTFPSSN